jgi:hypothetical protein
MAAQRNWFALVTSAIALVLGALLVIGRSPWFYGMPIALAIATYALARRLRKGTEAQITRHSYALSAPKAPGRVGSIVDKLGTRGYQPEVRTLTEVGEAGPPPSSEAELAGAQLKIVDKRADAELGQLTVRIRVEDTGALVGYIEADDTGPGFYDEMAQFMILDMATVVEGLEYVKMGPTPERRAARLLEDELPKRPYGLALL